MTADRIPNNKLSQIDDNVRCRIPTRLEHRTAGERRVDAGENDASEANPTLEDFVASLYTEIMKVTPLPMPSPDFSQPEYMSPSKSFLCLKFIAYVQG